MEIAGRVGLLSLAPPSLAEEDVSQVVEVAAAGDAKVSSFGYLMEPG